MKMHGNLVRSVWLLSLVAAFLLFAGAAFGQSVSICPGDDPPADPPADFDRDGFFDFNECQGLEMWDDGLEEVEDGLEVELDGEWGSVLPSCYGRVDLDRRYCASAEQSDLFIIVAPASPSSLPPGPLETVALPISDGGLGLNVHLLREMGAPGNRRVSPSSYQKAIRITESLNPDGEILGQANYGTPNNIDRATIWTTRIANFVVAACSDDEHCVSTTGAMGRAEVTDELARWVMEHEVGHMFQLSANYNKRFGGYHLKVGTNSVMAQFVSYSTSKKSGLTTFFIPQTFDPQSQADAQLIVQ